MQSNILAPLLLQDKKALDFENDFPDFNWLAIMTEEKGVFDLMEKYMDEEDAKKQLA